MDAAPLFFGNLRPNWFIGIGSGGPVAGIGITSGGNGGFLFG